MERSNFLNIQLVVSDIDGTLLNSKNEFEPRTEDAVRRFIRDKHCGFTFCTGRPFPLAKPFADYLELTLPFIYSSNSIYDPRNKVFISKPSFKSEQIKEIAKISAKFNVGILAHTKENLVCQVNDEDWKTIQSFEWMNGKVIEHAVRINEITYKIQEGILRIDVFSEGKTPSTILREVEKTVPDVFAVEMNRSIEITPSGMQKGYALRKISHLLNIPLNHIMAVGDSMNDIQLLQEAGYGVAMATAPDALKEIADAVIPSADENGLVSALEIIR